MVTLAWHVAALQRQDRLPKLEQLLSRKPVKRQSAAEIKASFLAVFGKKGA